MVPLGFLGFRVKFYTCNMTIAMNWFQFYNTQRFCFLQSNAANENWRNQNAEIKTQLQFKKTHMVFLIAKTIKWNSTEVTALHYVYFRSLGTSLYYSCWILHRFFHHQWTIIILQQIKDPFMNILLNSKTQTYCTLKLWEQIFTRSSIAQIR